MGCTNSKSVTVVQPITANTVPAEVLNKTTKEQNPWDDVTDVKGSQVDSRNFKDPGLSEIKMNESNINSQK